MEIRTSNRVLLPTQDIQELHAGERLRLVLSGKVLGVHKSKSEANFQTSSAPDHQQPWHFRRLGCGDDLRGIRTEELHAVYHGIMPSKHRGECFLVLYVP